MALIEPKVILGQVLVQERRGYRMGSKAAVDRLDGVPDTQSGSKVVTEPLTERGEPSEPTEKIGGPCRTRTYDPLIKSQLLYQLS